MKATIQSFDKTRGQGYLTLADGSLYIIYASNMKGKKTWCPETACVFYEPGQKIKYKIEHDRFVIGLTPAHVDHDKWNSLDQSRLAFKCNENGKAINGLFGGTK